MRVLFIILIIFIFGCGGKPKVNNKQAALLHLNLGTGLLADGNLPQAFKSLFMARKLDPENPATHNNLGIAFTLRKKYKNAMESFNEALKLQPDYTDARNNLGRLYCDTGKYKKCVQILEQAQQDLTYGYPEKILSNLGFAYFKDGQFQKSKKVLRSSLEIRPKDCKTFYFYSRTYYELEDYEHSAPLFDRTLKICRGENFEEPRYYSGLSYLKLGQLEMATAKFEEVINNAPLSEYADRSKNMLKLMAKANKR